MLECLRLGSTDRSGETGESWSDVHLPKWTGRCRPGEDGSNGRKWGIYIESY